MSKINALWYCRVLTAVITLFLALSYLGDGILDSILKFILFLSLSFFVGVKPELSGKIKFRETVFYLAFFLSASIILSRFFEASTLTVKITPFAAIRLLILTPFFEELFFRGALLKGDMSIFNIFLSALTFALFHTREAFFPAFILGLMLALSYKRTKNFLVPLILHISNNALALILMAF